MSDFASRLLGRSLGTLPVAEPRLRARFEGAPESPALPQTVDAEHVEHEDARAPRRRTVLEAHAEPLAPEQPPLAARDATRPKRGSATPQLGSAPRDASNASGSALLGRDEFAARASSTLSPALAASSPQGASPREPGAPRFERGADPGVREDRVAITSQELERHPDRATSPFAERRAPRVPALTREPDVTTVHVTIGRIEVRASAKAPPAAQAHRPTKNESVLTIEQYAKQRRDALR